MTTPPVPTVPAGPFVAWLHRQVEQHGLNVARERLQLGGEVMQKLLSTSDDDRLAVDRVDRFLTRADTVETLASLYPDDQRPRRRDRGRIYACDEQTLIRAHSMHMDGMSTRDVARAIFDDCYAATPNSLALSLLNAWRARGWEIRSQREATAAKNRAAGWRPRCSHVHAMGTRKGQRCSRRTVNNDEWCWHHEPSRIAAGVHRVRTGAR